MGYMMLIAECINCGRTMTCNPGRVPSIRVNGVREPVCRKCIEEANPQRIAKGLEPFVIPEGAYEAEEVD